MVFYHFWNVKFITEAKDFCVFFDGSYKIFSENGGTFGFLEIKIRVKDVSEQSNWI